MYVFIEYIENLFLQLINIFLSHLTAKSSFKKSISSQRSSTSKENSYFMNFLT
jgi:hypothetical protein